VNELEDAVLRLTPAELDAFRTWFAEFAAARSKVALTHWTGMLKCPDSADVSAPADRQLASLGDDTRIWHQSNKDRTTSSGYLFPASVTDRTITQHFASADVLIRAIAGRWWGLADSDSTRI